MAGLLPGCLQGTASIERALFRADLALWESWCFSIGACPAVTEFRAYQQGLLALLGM